jgi:hypothetical protein
MAHKRYTRAVEMLARVRRLGITLPAATPATTELQAEPVADRGNVRAIA